jgi:hypothetical protein
MLQANNDRLCHQKVLSLSLSLDCEVLNYNHMALKYSSNIVVGGRLEEKIRPSKEVSTYSFFFFFFG